MAKNKFRSSRRQFLGASAATAGTLAVGTYLPRAWAAEPQWTTAHRVHLEGLSR